MVAIIGVIVFFACSMAFFFVGALNLLSDGNIGYTLGMYLLSLFFAGKSYSLRFHHNERWQDFLCLIAEIKESILDLIGGGLFVFSLIGIPLSLIMFFVVLIGAVIDIFIPLTWLEIWLPISAIAIIFSLLCFFSGSFLIDRNYE